MKIKAMIACILAVAMLAAGAVPAFAVYDVRTEATDYGTLYGNLQLTRPQNSNDSSRVTCLASLTTGNQKVDKVIAYFEIWSCYYGDEIWRETKTETNASNATAAVTIWLFDELVNIYGRAEIRHTKSFAVYPRLYSV